MNVYFLVEGRRTEPRVYRQWLQQLLPEWEEVQGFDEVAQRTYFLRGALRKSPSLKERLRASILEVNQCQYDYLVVCIDAEEYAVGEVKEGFREMLATLDSEGVALRGGITFEIVIQNKCIETWFLGNRKIFSRHPQDPDLIAFIRHFNVCVDDPELMVCPIGDERFGSVAQFHYEYLRKLLAEKNLHYSKPRPDIVTQPHYLVELQKRVQDTQHLHSLRHFLDLCELLKCNPRSYREAADA